MNGIIEIIGEVCKQAGQSIGKDINYIFGNTTYVNSILKTIEKGSFRFPLIILHTPFNETRGYDKSLSGEAKIAVTIAVRTKSDYTNTKRLNESFVKQLRPMYDAFIQAFRNHNQIAIQYDEQIPHVYRERYDLGSSGAMDSNGKKLDDLIDAIEIENLEIKVKTKKCYGNRL